MFFQTIKHPGINSGLDLINQGTADTFGLGLETEEDYTGHRKLFALKDGAAVAYWKPDYWQKEGYDQAGWYCIRTHKLLLADLFWNTEGAA